MDVAQLVELLVVVQAVAGSNPVVHLSIKCLQTGRFGWAEEVEFRSNRVGNGALFQALLAQ